MAAPYASVRTSASFEMAERRCHGATPAMQSPVDEAPAGTAAFPQLAPMMERFVPHHASSTNEAWRAAMGEGGHSFRSASATSQHHNRVPRSVTGLPGLDRIPTRRLRRRRGSADTGRAPPPGSHPTASTPAPTTPAPKASQQLVADSRKRSFTPTPATDPRMSYRHGRSFGMLRAVLTCEECGCKSETGSGWFWLHRGRPRRWRGSLRLYLCPRARSAS